MICVIFRPNLGNYNGFCLAGPCLGVEPAHGSSWREVQSRIFTTPPAPVCILTFLAQKPLHFCVCLTGGLWAEVFQMLFFLRLPCMEAEDSSPLLSIPSTFPIHSPSPPPTNSRFHKLLFFFFFKGIPFREMTLTFRHVHLTLGWFELHEGNGHFFQLQTFVYTSIVSD